MNVGFISLGCSKNLIDTEVTIGKFKEHKFTIVNDATNADIIVVNTCGFIDSAKEEAIQTLLEMADLKQGRCKYLIAMGCLVQRYYEDLKKSMPEVDLWIKLDEYDHLWDKIEDLVKRDIIKESKTKSSKQITKIPKMPMFEQYDFMNKTVTTGKNFAYLKIGEGCSNRCTYCAIPYIRGNFVSRKMEDILQEVRNLTANGYKEIVLTGIHISSYGLDFEHTADEQEDYGPFKNSALIDLIEALSGIEGLERIRLGSLEPRIITENFVRRLCKVPQICPHFHLSLQSGCDETLKRMNRHYTTALYLEKCGILRQYFDRPALTTDVIVGFPGETEEEFAQTERFLETVHFSDMHIFKYSKRRGTKAADMPNQIDPQIQSVRSEKLIALGERMKDDFLEACKDQEQIVLIEEETEIGGTKYMTGHSKNYIRCAFEMDGLVPNMVIKGTINSKLNEEFVFCKRID